MDEPPASEMCHARLRIVDIAAAIYCYIVLLIAI